LVSPISNCPGPLHPVAGQEPHSTLPQVLHRVSSQGRETVDSVPHYQEGNPALQGRPSVVDSLHAVVSSIAVGDDLMRPHHWNTIATIIPFRGHGIFPNLTSPPHRRQDHQHHQYSSPQDSFPRSITKPIGRGINGFLFSGPGLAIIPKSPPLLLRFNKPSPWPSPSSRRGLSTSLSSHSQSLSAGRAGLLGHSAQLGALASRRDDKRRQGVSSPVPTLTSSSLAT